MHCKNNVELARARAKIIKTYLLATFPKIKPEKLKLSWFGVSETIKTTNKNKIKVDTSINFFSSAG
jgi:hypothetical protein